MWLSLEKIAYTSVSAARRRILERVVARNVLGHSEMAAQWGVPQSADWGSVAERCNVRRTFILGSGSSINEYSKAMFEQVGLGWSVALNAWCKNHWFTPDALMVEVLDKIFWEELERTASPGRPSEIFVTRLFTAEKSPTKNLQRVPDGLRDDVRHYVAVPMLGLSPSSYADYVSHLLAMKDCFPHVTGPNRTSVERAVVMAALAGAEEVILCGVDLNGPSFWEGEPRDVSMRHGTDSGKSFRRSVARRLPVLASVLKSRLGATVTLGLERGKLAGVLPVHTWGTGHRHQGRSG